MIKISVFVLVIHAFLPHLHHEQISENSNIYFHANIRNLCDAIKLAFHEDFKIKFENQTKLLKNEISKKIDFEKFICTKIDFFEFYYFKKNFSHYIYTSFYNDFKYYPKLLRAPPLNI